MARSLDQTIQYSSVLIIEPYAQETVTSDDRAYTWFKSRLLQILSHPTRQALPLASRLDELSTSLTPTNLLPLSSSDILIIKSGGTLVVDGVEINFANPAFPGFSLRKSYLVFTTLSSDNKTALVPLGVNGICELLNTNSLHSLGSEDSAVAREVNGLSLSAFRDRLARTDR